MLIDQWHKEKGWSGCGYHFVITNGKTTTQTPYLRAQDGQIQTGRRLNANGAHARNYNSEYLGICLIGKTEFTEHQFRALHFLLKDLMHQYNITPENIIGHYQCSTAGGKTCPNFNVPQFLTSILE